MARLDGDVGRASSSDGADGLTRLVIVDGHAAIADALAALLGLEPDMRVVGVASDIERAERLIEELSPHVVVCDVVFDGREAGFDLVRRTDGHARFLVLTAYDSPSYRATAVRVGAAGYLTKAADRTTIAAAVRQIRAGRRAFSHDVLRSAAQAPAPPTTRERQLLVLLGDGATNDQIAEALGIRAKTVEGMLRRLFDRYGTQNRTQLARYADREGWLR